MKELSIEEKARRYDEAIERANSLLSGNQLGNAWIYKLLPELKESESEKIRKHLISLFEKFVTLGVANECETSEIKVDDVLAWLEAQGEQKPVNEHKFNIGDWITRGEHYTYKIIAVGQGLYVVNKNNEEEVSLTFKYIEKYFHFWTIQDAKDGDVLVYRDEQWVFLYKDRLDDTTFRYYALVSEKGLMIDDAAYTALPKSITPATKEQRDTLFAKMREAGYEWDADKKELKEIEQKPAEWSEEDDIRLNATVSFLKRYKGIDHENTGVCISWLKSLRPQSHWKPSGEQIKALNYVINIMASSESPKENDYYYNVFKDLREQLKKIKGLEL